MEPEGMEDMEKSLSEEGSRKGYDFGDVSGRVLKCAVEVHKELGRFFLETTYQAALAQEFLSEGLEFSRECWVDILYKGKKVDKRRVDFVVEDLLVEIKAKESLDKVDFMQTLSYLKSTCFRVALLINFGPPTIQVKRLEYDEEKERGRKKG